MAMLPFAKMSRKARGVFTTLAIFGSAMLIGDGVITPAISVISAIEGLNLGISGINPYAPYIAAVVSGKIKRELKRDFHFDTQDIICLFYGTKFWNS